MNMNVAESTRLVIEMLGMGLAKIPRITKVIFPAYIALAPMNDILRLSDIKLGAQDVFWEEKGPYTGEISPLMLQGTCDYVIIGHSERRRLFSETGEITNKKVRAAQQYGLSPILCVGESLKENEGNGTERVISGQLESGLKGVTDYHNLIIAYEPIWAIGTGKAASGRQAGESGAIIRQSLERIGGKEASAVVRILYGGSVTPENIAEYAKQPEIDGVLVGGASLRAADFVSIIQQTYALKYT